MSPTAIAPSISVFRRRGEVVTPAGHDGPVMDSPQTPWQSPGKTPTVIDIDRVRCDWARNYASVHARRRRVGVSIALTLVCCSAVSSYHLLGADNLRAIERYVLVSVISLAPFGLALFSAAIRLKGHTEAKGWAFAWLMAGASAVVGFLAYGEHLGGWLHASFSLGQVAILAICLRVPVNQNFEDKVVLPRILNTEEPTESDGGSPVLVDFRAAEEMAAAWLRRFGYRDAEVTPPGQDGGIDVLARGAIAQVKLWHTKRVGIREVQRLTGLTNPGQKSFYFARSGYTRQALEWSTDPAHRIALFELGSDGNLRAANFTAIRTLYKAPFRMPSSFHRGMSIKAKLIIGLPVAILTVWLSVTVVIIFALPGMKVTPFLVLYFAGQWLLLLWIFYSVLGKDFRRFVAAFRVWRAGESWPGWRVILTDVIPVDRDAGLPPDDFTGYFKKGGLGLFMLVVEALVGLRQVKEWVLCKLGVSRRAKVPFGIGTLMATAFLLDVKEFSDKPKPGRSARRKRPSRVG